ncbi:hypothetical protein SAMN02799620_03687 [Mycolicibacterium fluoranthenivorans]|uniref:Uncharacterized protein n=1 Tax=Mycolicibacterium fluoranthenivorans TaxID=258505 RepID=A0A1G4WK29_9MYCO|nr:hypothetical protein SAMN02799620_03687 [Mycolicibacterium fluoranthenivorans]
MESRDEVEDVQKPEDDHYRARGDESRATRRWWRWAMFIRGRRFVWTQQAIVVFTVPASTVEAAANTDNDQCHTAGGEQGCADSSADPRSADTLGEHVLRHHMFP